MPPRYAPRIWLSGNDFHICFPGFGPEGADHTVRVPYDRWSVEILRHFLSTHIGENVPLAIGHPCVPTQLQMEAIYNHMKNTGTIKRAVPLVVNRPATPKMSIDLAALGLVKS